jgi:hypothetical protein
VCDREEREERDRDKDRQTDKQTDRQTDRRGSTCLTAVTHRFMTAKENFTPCGDARGDHYTHRHHGSKMCNMKVQAIART